MNGFLYTITLEEPVLANSLGGEPNSARSLYYIPGGLIRGAVINTYINKDSNNDDFRSLFLNGETRFLNAYPLLNNERTLPIPLKYKKPKYFESSSFGNIKLKSNLLLKDSTAEENEAKSPWLINALENKWVINIHTQRDAKKGRSTIESGAVYRYIALPAGMKFQGAVLSKNAGTIKNMLDKAKTILLGKARTAGYGSASIETQSLPKDWREIDGAPQADVKEFTLILLSPALVRNEDGQFTLDISTSLSKRIGANVTIDREKSFCKTEIIGGFNRKWGLPLPQATAIAAGSVLYIKLEEVVTSKKLRELEETGIGERRAEGFGAIAAIVSLPDIPDKKENWEVVALNKKKSSDTEAILTGEDNQIADMMLTRLLRRDLEEIILKTAWEICNEYISESVPNSQISRWRVIVRDSLAKRGTTIKIDGVEKDFDPIHRMMDFYHAENKKRSPVWGKMEKAKIKFAGAPVRLAEWIETVLSNPASVNEILESAPTLHKVINSDPIQLSSYLKIEYRLRMIDSVLAVMAKKNNSKGGKNG